MNIEFQSGHNTVNEWLISYLTDKLMEFHHRYKNISRAQICFREQSGVPDDKVCEIDLTIYEGSIFVHRNAASFEQAVQEVLTILAEKIEERVKSQNEIPDLVTSTVKI